jgi:hypothetical protein
MLGAILVAASPKRPRDCDKGVSGTKDYAIGPNIA